jgi:hypothetical protein
VDIENLEVRGQKSEIGIEGPKVRERFWLTSDL